ncbi:hypothetical protein E2C01_089613 [Portunus trituberculatus]|uniref:Uncharacterized protein n=1 Tax=Portunus trituberculatus TaxID=210409 RepID=A0A5B7JE06_PORTR|nr:hypothetical protein [Portunus trituberculatus]
MAGKTHLSHQALSGKHYTTYQFQKTPVLTSTLKHLLTRTPLQLHITQDIIYIAATKLPRESTDWLALHASTCYSGLAWQSGSHKGSRLTQSPHRQATALQASRSALRAAGQRERLPWLTKCQCCIPKGGAIKILRHKYSPD